VHPLVGEFLSIGSLVEKLLHLDPLWIYVIVALLVFLEDAVFIGFAIPGETAAIVAGVASSLEHVDLGLAIVIVVSAAILGDSVGYEVGKHFFGPKVLHSGLLSRHRARIDGAHDFLRRRGGIAVFLGRFTAFFRAMMPALAGSAHLPYRTFLKWNAIGGVVWGTLWVVVGHIAGSSYHAIEQKVGRSSGIAAVVLVVLLLVIWKIRSERRAD
jgi:membrane-associated protein